MLAALRCLLLRSRALTLSLRVRACKVRRISSTAPHFPRGIQLRPYQETCLQACLETLQEGDATRIGISLPTGSGKTTIFVSLISMLQPPKQNPDARRALIIVNSAELARQSAEQVRRMFPDLSVEIDQGPKYKATGMADITVATYQSLLRDIRLAKFDPVGLKCIIVDEAHHAAAPSYRKILSRFHRDIRHPHDVDFEPPNLPHEIPIIGFSATFSRHDSLALSSVFQRIVYHRDFLMMIKEQWLCNVRFTTVKADLNLDNVTINTRSGEFNPTSLAHVINTETVRKLVVSSWLDKASGIRRSTLVFCINLDHLKELTDTFRRAGIDARYVYAGTPAKERKELIDGFKAGEYPVLLNVGVLTEGVDIPNIDCVIVARPTRSRNLFAQMIGRGMRLSPQTGKQDCHIIDFIDITSRVPGIVSTPTLFGLNPDVLIEDAAPEDLEERAADLLDEAEDEEMETDVTSISSNSDSSDDNIPDPRSVTYTDYDNPFDLIQDGSGAPHLITISRFGWVGCGGDVYVLECMGKGYIKVEPGKDEEEEPMFYAHYVQPIPEWERRQSRHKKVRFRRPRHILSAKTLDEAVRGCDKYATSKVAPGNLAFGLYRTARWRKQPASESQKTAIKKWLDRSQNGNEVKGKRVDVDSLNKGQAAQLMTRLIHGAKGRYDKKVKQKVSLALKQARTEEKERLRQARERVTVGPLLAGNQIQEQRAQA